jgi:serine/threonine-protein kinase RsbW
MARSRASSSPTPAPGSHRGTIAVVNEQGAMEAAQSRVIMLVESLGYPKASVFALRLTLHEAIINAFKHGHKTLPGSVPIYVRYDVAADHVDLEIEDQGPGFRPEEVPDPTLEENLERGSGRGLLLIRAYMSRVEYNEKGNALRMRYLRPAAQG